MFKQLLIAASICLTFSAMADVPQGKVSEVYKMDGQTVCLKEIQKELTPMLLRAEQESGVKYKFLPRAGLIVQGDDARTGLRLDVNRVDNGLNDKVASVDYYWVEERGSMCQPAYLVFERTN